MEPVRTGQHGEIYSLGTQKKKAHFRSVRVKDIRMKKQRIDWNSAIFSHFFLGDIKKLLFFFLLLFDFISFGQLKTLH